MEAERAKSAGGSWATFHAEMMARGEQKNDENSKRRTFPTKSCVRVSRGGFVGERELEAEDMAAWILASISSFVGSAPAAAEAYMC